MRRRTILFGVLVVVILVVLGIVLIPRLIHSQQFAAPAYFPAQEWRTSAPEEQGIDSAKLAEGLRAIQEQNIPIDSLLVIRNGSIILDGYFYPYDGTFPHNLASVTKSVMTTLIGIAVDQGKIQLDQPMWSFFPDRTIANLDANKKKITVRHLAGMVNGFESGCMAKDEATLDAMRSAPDWIQAALDRKMAQEPGSGFCYDSPGMHLLSAILQESTGMSALDFARKYFFEPLGIQDVVWESDPQGYTHGWGDLHLKPTDLARLGYLWLNHGVWNGRQIVSRGWVIDSVKAQTKTGEDSYGYGWWVSPQDFYAKGRGGQYMHVISSLNAVVVMTGAGLEYDQVVPYLLTAMGDPKRSLAPNPAGVAQLEKALAGILQPPAPMASIPIPEIARIVSSRVYIFPPNTAGVENLSLEYIDSSQAMLHIKLNRSAKILDWPIGLDGKYLLSAEGLALRGYWSDPHTFVFEIFDIGKVTYQLNFDDDRVMIDAPEAGIKIEGLRKNP